MSVVVQTGGKVTCRNRGVRYNHVSQPRGVRYNPELQPLVSELDDAAARVHVVVLLGGECMLPSGLKPTRVATALSPQQDNNVYACGGVLELQHEWLQLAVVPHTTVSTQWLCLTPRG